MTISFPDPHLLMEAPMTVDTDARKPRHRLLLATAALLIVGGGVVWGATGSSGSTPSPLTLQAEEGNSGGRCGNLTMETLLEHASEHTAAFEGTVVSVQGEQVTLDVDHWYTDDASASVVLTVAASDEDPLVFEVGEHGHIVAFDGIVGYCTNMFWQVDPDLAKLFHQTYEVGIR